MSIILLLSKVVLRLFPYVTHRCPGCSAVFIRILLVLLPLRFVQLAFKHIKLPGPESFVELQPFHRPGHDTRVKTAGMRPSMDGPFEQAGALQHLDMLGGCRKRHVKRFSQLRYRPFLRCDHAHHLSSGRISQSMEDVIQLFFIILFNHMVKYNGATS